MNINFEKTDRLIELIENSSMELFGYNFIGAYELKNSKNKKIQVLYNELININTNNLPELNKHTERLKSFGRAYGCENNVAKAEDFLKLTFDEEQILNHLKRTYWQIQHLFSFKNDNNNNFSDTEGLRNLIEKDFPNEPYKEVIIEVIQKQEPKVKDIEKEFWQNCPDTDKINDLCDIYWERFKGHLKEVDKNYYSMDAVLFDEKNRLNQYFKELRKCGLLQQKEIYAECMFSHIAEQINLVSDKVVSLFRMLRASANKQKPELQQNPLKKIWLAESKISIDDFLKLGIDKSIWDNQYQIITKKGSLYGTGKTLLGSLSIALKGFAISNNTDYKEIGKAFCIFFKVPIKEETKEPFKAFSSGNSKLISQLIRAFNIKK